LIPIAAGAVLAIALSRPPCTESAAAETLAEDGYDLWLRYVQIDSDHLGPYRSAVTQIVAPTLSPPSELRKLNW